MQSSRCWENLAATGLAPPRRHCGAFSSFIYATLLTILVAAMQLCGAGNPGRGPLWGGLSRWLFARRIPASIPAPRAKPKTALGKNERQRLSEQSIDSRIE